MDSGDPIFTQALLQDIAAVADERYEKVRSAAMTWMLVAKRVGVVKDVARMIARMVWAMREEVAWERREDGKEEGKRRKTGQ